MSTLALIPLSSNHQWLQMETVNYCISTIFTSSNSFVNIKIKYFKGMYIYFMHILFRWHQPSSAWPPPNEPLASASHWWHHSPLLGCILHLSLVASSILLHIWSSITALPLPFTTTTHPPIHPNRLSLVPTLSEIYYLEQTSESN